MTADQLREILRQDGDEFANDVFRALQNFEGSGNRYHDEETLGDVIASAIGAVIVDVLDTVEQTAIEERIRAMLKRLADR